MGKIKCNYYADVFTTQVDEEINNLKRKIIEDFQLTRPEEFSITNRIGRGKFSQIFLAKDTKGK